MMREDDRFSTFGLMVLLVRLAGIVSTVQR